MRIASIAAIVLSVASLVQIEQAHSSHQNCSVVYLLNVQPYPDESEFSGFDGGLRLIPAAHLAAEEINNRSDILEGRELRVVDIDAEACGRGLITKGLINLYRELLTRPCVVGVIGFVCSSVTNVLAPIIGYQNIGYVTLANSVSPAHRNIVQYPNLFHSISSSSVHNIVIVSLMKMFNWKRIGLVFDSTSIFFRSTANDFAQRVLNSSEANLTAAVPISNSLKVIQEAFNIINSEEARISYWLGNDGQNALCLCEAYHRKFLWPGYVYILRYNPNIVANILNANTNCTKDELLKAMEGVFSLDYRLFVEEDTVLFSGWSYSEFRQRYAKLLNEFAIRYNMNLSQSIYANSFYDQVWTFALAVNHSLPSIKSKNLSLTDYMITNAQQISNILKSELENLAFQGASGWIQFDVNHEIPSFIDIFQIQNGNAKRIAIYDPFMMNITPTKYFPDDIPNDTFDTVYEFLPLWLGVCVFIIQGLLFCLITINTIFLFWWRDEREVKATSFLLSMLLTIGCYLLCIGPVIRTIYRVVVIHNTMTLTVMCNVNLWSTSLGLDLLLATLLFRIFRVVHVFRSFQKTSKYFSDEYLLLYSLLTCSVKVIILIIWSIVDLYRSRIDREYIPTATPAKYKAIVFCSCDSLAVFLSISYVYSIVLLSLVMFLAIQTRHIKKTVFKDTKKVNLFVFLVIITLTTTIPLSLIFSQLEIETGADLSEWLGVCLVATMCQLCLIVPKLLPLAVKKDKIRRGKTLSREYTLTSEFEWIRRKSRHSLSKLIT